MRRDILKLRFPIPLIPEQGSFTIVFENSCADNISFENGFPISQKHGGGTETKSIAYTAERNNGMAKFSAEKRREEVILKMKDNCDITAEVNRSTGKLDVRLNNFCDYFEEESGRLFSNRECWYCKYGDFGIFTEHPTEIGVCRYKE